jgi:hypothetical protein
MAKILLELSPHGAEVRELLASGLPEQILAGRVLDSLASDLIDFGGAVKRAYAAARRRATPAAVLQRAPRRERFAETTARSERTS